jgi:hypothetical protein
MEGHAVNQALAFAAWVFVYSEAQAGDRQNCLDNFDKLAAKSIKCDSRTSRTS